MSKHAYCSEGDHYPDEVVVYPPGYEVGIVLHNDGTVTNRYEDGVVGVTANDVASAECEDTAYCEEHAGCEVDWHQEAAYRAHFARIPVSWKARVRKVYDSLEELRAYNATYRIVPRLGFETAQQLWDANPVIGGSTDPRALRVIRK